MNDPLLELLQFFRDIGVLNHLGTVSVFMGLFFDVAQPISPPSSIPMFVSVGPWISFRAGKAVRV